MTLRGGEAATVIRDDMRSCPWSSTCDRVLAATSGPRARRDYYDVFLPTRMQHTARCPGRNCP